MKTCPICHGTKKFLLGGMDCYICGKTGMVPDVYCPADPPKKLGKSIFPIRINWWYSLDVQGDYIVILQRHMFLWWKWKIVNACFCKVTDPIKSLETI